jgi:hypothetical protein
MVDLVVGTAVGWLPINLNTQSAGPIDILQLSAAMTVAECRARIRERLEKRR